MSILGKFRKQPVEVEIYGIQFAQDMSATDEIVSAWVMLARKTAPAWDQSVKTTPYTATAADADTIVVATANVTLPATPADGYRLSVANQNQSAGITVGPFNLPVRGAVVVLGKAGGWVLEAQAQGVLVSAPQDQRFRTTVSGGILTQTYKAQVTVTTAEGRVLQDEYLVSIKED